MGAVLDKIVIIGHRGTGKTSLLKRWKSYCPHFIFADLDEEIEKDTNLSIAEIFAKMGETTFRNLERKLWAELQNKNIISVGGGFNLELISSDWKILWARRDSDDADKIFLDRPSLSDYKNRFEIREKLFAEKANFVYTIPEGLLDKGDEEEKKILTENMDSVGGAVTLPQKIYPDCLIEIRDDLKPAFYDTPQLLYSVRSGITYPANTKIDWDIKKPIPSGLSPFIISTHGNSFEPLLPYENSGSLLKFCPMVKTWSELQAGIDWQKKNPAKRVFLPRSENGKWSWFRLWMKGKQALNFWREGSGSAPDQPTLWEWLSHPNQVSQFAAVLGNPIKHSFSPVYHKTFFKSKSLPFYRISIEENEWDQAISILDELGLVAAAVTSPLKSKAGEFVKQSALNTIWKSENKWAGANTDKTGALALVQGYESQSCVVWGGGGVLETLKDILPTASFYSAQKAQPREGANEIKDPEVLIWADPFNSIENVPHNWKPKTVIDLSYQDNSPGKLYAQKIKANYISGIKMFLSQADEQQKIWDQKLS